MTQLIPEVRVDKNGRETTRWVKPGWAKAAGGKKNIPPVSGEHLKAQSALLDILNRNNMYPREGLDSAIAASVRGRDAERLVEFLSAPRTHSIARELNRVVMINIENPKIGTGLNRLLMSHYDNAAAAGIAGVTQFLTGIGEMNRELSPEQEWALLKVTDAASYSDAVQEVNVPFPFDAYGLTNEELVDFVVENPDKCDDIAVIVSERKTVDVKTIEGLLNSSIHGSLKHGNL